MTSLFTLAACTRPTQDIGDGGIRIHIPTKSEYFAGKEGQQSQSAVDYDKLCFAVQVLAPDIDPSGNQCTWVKSSIAIGYVAPGGSLVLKVPKGSTRTFEVYGFLRNSTSESCGALPTNIGQAELDRTYKLGQSAEINITQDSQDVAISLQIPDASDTLAQHITFPPTCAAQGWTPDGSPKSASFTLKNSKMKGSTSVLLESSTYRALGNVTDVGSDSVPYSSSFKIK